MENTPYEPTEEILNELGCDFWAHGDDPCITKDGVDLCELFRQIGKFKMFKRTEGVSTTSITSKLMTLAEELSKDKLETKSANSSPLKLTEKMQNPPKQTFLATSRRINDFSNKNVPKATDTIVYIQGSFDMLHHGHMKRLELAKSMGDFLYVGLWDDEMVRYYRGDMFPMQSLQERVLMTLSVKHVDDVIIGAPYILTQDLIKTLNINKVVVITDTEEDVPMPLF